MGVNVQGIKSIIHRYKIDRGRLRIVEKWRSQRAYIYSSIGNREAKELICVFMTHGHELRWGRMLKGMGVLGRGGLKKEKNGTTLIA